MKPSSRRSTVLGYCPRQRDLREEVAGGATVFWGTGSQGSGFGMRPVQRPDKPRELDSWCGTPLSLQCPGDPGSHS